MFRKVISIIVIILSALAMIIQFQPGTFNYASSRVIAAPAATVFPYVNNLRKFNEWSPWKDMDPNAKIVFSGPESGIGASFSWSGNDKVGEGKETIVQSFKNQYVELRLDFIKPVPGTNTVTFELAQEGNGTRVTWGMRGRKNFMMKAMGMVVDCKKMMTDIFDQGLENLEKTVTSK